MKDKMTAVEWLVQQIETGKIEIIYSDKIHSIRCLPEFVKAALEMEKEQKEKMYSEEEVIDLLAKFRRENRGKDFIPFKDIQEWFEQFKKDKL